jgi:D-glycero-alpha-D-manno-heptose 1-phosphate guanylyltransferase
MSDSFLCTLPSGGDAGVAVILAGGFGTRIRHLLGDLPKPMLPVAGRPFLEWVVRYLVRQGVNRFVLSTGFRSEVVKRHFADQPVKGIEVVCISETEPLGTAGGFLHAVERSGLDGSIWFVANGDSLLLTDAFQQLRTTVQQATTSSAILGLEVPDAGRFGSLRIAPDGELISFSEKRTGVGLINAGVYAFRRELLEAFPPVRPLSFETDVFPSLLARGYRIQVVDCLGAFLDIGTEESLAQAEGFIRNHDHWFY